MQTVLLLLCVALGLGLAGALAVLASRQKQVTEALKKRTEVQAKLEDAERQLAAARHDLTQRQGEAGAANADADKRLREAKAEVERLSAAVSAAETKLAEETRVAGEARAQAASVDPAAIAREAEERALGALRSEVESAGAKVAAAAEALGRAERDLQLSTQRVQQLEEQTARLAQEQKAAEDRLARLQEASDEKITRLQHELARRALAEVAAVPDSDQCLRSVIGAAQEGVALLDANGRILTWNRSAAAIFGYAAGEVEGSGLAGIIEAADVVQADRELANVRAAAAAGVELSAPHLFEVRGVRKGGEQFPLEVSLTAWTEAGQPRYAVLLRDATDRLAAEESRRAQEAAEEASRAKSQFLANMSHELRTPLNAIIGFSEILHDRTFGDLTPKQDRYVGNILTSGRHLLSLINDILDLSKIEAGHVDLEYAAFPVSLAMRNLDNLVKGLVSKKNISLKIEVADDLPQLVADQAKFKQVLYNLISNAVKFTPEGGTVSVSATQGATGWLTVSVKDTGIGIKKEDFNRVFKEFEQVDSSYSRQQQGTGLGLSLTRRFVEMHGGRIWVDSDGENQGTTFSFSLPFSPAGDVLKTVLVTAPEGARPVEEAVSEAAAVEADAESIAPTSAGRTPGAGKGMILVVDDDRSAGELICHTLREGGYTVEQAFRGDDVLRLARELNPAAITLDVELPGKDGWQILAELKEDASTRDIPVLVVSVTKDREKAMELGATGCYVKPVEKNLLLGGVKSALIARKRRMDRLALAAKMSVFSAGNASTAVAAPDGVPAAAGTAGAAKATGRSRKPAAVGARSEDAAAE